MVNFRPRSAAHLTESAVAAYHELARRLRHRPLTCRVSTAANHEKRRADTVSHDVYPNIDVTHLATKIPDKRGFLAAQLTAKQLRARPVAIWATCTIMFHRADKNAGDVGE
jgi:hypothetical protein